MKIIGLADGALRSSLRSGTRLVVWSVAFIGYFISMVFLSVDFAGEHGQWCLPVDHICIQVALISHNVCSGGRAGRSPKDATTNMAALSQRKPKYCF